MRRYCLALDLQNDPELIKQYEAYHQDVWPEVEQSIKDAGIHSLEIYRVEDRMFMILEVDDTFSFERKKQMDDNNEKVQAWETLMWKFQKALPFAKPGEKWILMQQVYAL